MNKKTLLLIIFLPIFFLAAVTAHNNNPRVIISRLFKNKAFHKKTLKYRVYFFGIIPAGEAAFELGAQEEFQGKKAYHLKATASTLKYFSKAFSGNVVLESYVDSADLNPILFKQSIVVNGKESVNKEIIYNQKEGFMSIAGVRRAVLPDTQDSLSAMLKLMRFDFAKNKEFKMNINPYKKNYFFQGLAEPAEVSVDSKIYKTFSLKGRVFRQEKNPYHQSKVKAVLVKQEENIPILINVFSGGALIQARLVDFD